jgi:predicted ATPase
VHHDPSPSEARIQLNAAMHAYALAKIEPSPLIRLLHLELAKRHTQAALSLALLSR